MKEPTRAECLKKADLILNGQAVREEVSDWACEYVAADDPAVEDETVWEMLVYLSGFDLKDSPDAYLHTLEELRDWVQKYIKMHGGLEAKMEWHKHEKAVLLGPDSPGCFELTEFTFYTGYNEFYDKIPVFELKLADGQYDAVLRFEGVSAARLDDLESITDIRLGISPVDGGWESIRYYVDDGEGRMSFYCAKWVVLDMKKKQSPNVPAKRQGKAAAFRV